MCARPNRRVLSLMIVLLLPFAACGASDGDSGDGSGSDGGSGADGGGGAGGGGTDGPCALPDGAEVIMDWTNFAREGESGAPAYALATDGTDLYVDFFDTIVSVPLQGGDPTILYTSPEEIPLGFMTIADDDGLLVEESNSWIRLPFAATSTPAPVNLATPNGFLVAAFDPATDRLWATIENFETDTISLLELTADQPPITVISGQTIGRGRKWYRVGDAFYTQQDRDGSDDGLYRLDAGAAAFQPVVIEPAPQSILGVTDDSVFYTTGSFDAALSGIFVAPISGGAGTQLTTTFTIGGGDRDVNNDNVALNDATWLWLLTSDAARQVTDVPVQQCTTHQVLQHDGFLYTVTFGSLTGENTVWRIAL